MSNFSFTVQQANVLINITHTRVHTSVKTQASSDAPQILFYSRERRQWNVNTATAED